MERVETLIKKLQDQFAANASANDLLLTAQMLEAELVHLKNSTLVGKSSIVNIDIPQTILSINDLHSLQPEEKIIEVLQVDEAAIEAELEEIKRNAEAMQQMSANAKPAVVFEKEEYHIPTLVPQNNISTNNIPTHQQSQNKKEINETVTVNPASLNDKLKQANLDLGDTLTDTSVKDLKKAIGVNDRFLFINELFRGDEIMYERSIKTINSFNILPEAEYWIQRELKVKLSWVDGNETVKHFNQLVKRRFS